MAGTLYRVLVDMAYENARILNADIGTHFLDGENRRQVDVASTGMEPVTGVVTMSIEGTLPDILQWMIDKWEDEDLALEAFNQATSDGHAEPM